MLAVAAVVAALISMAALIEPFSWLPPISQVWGHCDGDCTLAHRFPGFWPHVIVNLAYAAAAAVGLIASAAAASDLRKAHAERFRNQPAVERYVTARSRLIWASAATAGLAALP